ncbi:hypothetical protein BD560DRAFT_488915 [Blakeslea trispora]|nr:hypothetical protein BD560DRAFT_488915 [Blakeslea trispora]
MTPKRSIRNRSSFSPEPRQEFETDSDTQGAYYKPPALPITHLQPHQVGFKRHRTSIETEREGYSRAKYERELSRKIPKNTEWQVISPIADEQLKQILNIVQNKAIVQAAGSITNDIEIYDQGRRYVQPTGRRIHQMCRKKLFPGHFSNHLLKSHKRNSTNEMAKEFNDILYAEAKLEFETTRTSDYVEELTTQLQQVKEESERLEDTAATFNDVCDDPNDYVQMLLKYSSSQSF